MFREILSLKPRIAELDLAHLGACLETLKLTLSTETRFFFACGALREMLICLSIVCGVSQILSWLAVNPTVIIHEEQ